MTRRSARITVRGLVQGVGFRFFCRRRATDSGLTGWVRNLPDNSVELWAEGPVEELKRFIADLRVGSSHARVEHVDVQFGDHTGKFDNFEISH
jgi:acylphosphatase